MKKPVSKFTSGPEYGTISKLYIRELFLNFSLYVADITQKI